MEKLGVDSKWLVMVNTVVRTDVSLWTVRTDVNHTISLKCRNKT